MWQLSKILARTELTEDSCVQPGSHVAGGFKGAGQAWSGSPCPRTGDGPGVRCAPGTLSAAFASAQALCVPVSVSGPLGAEFSHRPWSVPLPPLPAPALPTSKQCCRKQPNSQQEANRVPGLINSWVSYGRLSRACEGAMPRPGPVEACCGTERPSARCQPGVRRARGVHTAPLGRGHEAAPAAARGFSVAHNSRRSPPSLLPFLSAYQLTRNRAWSH